MMLCNEHNFSQRKIYVKQTCFCSSFMSNTLISMTLSPAALYFISEQSPGYCHLVKWKHNSFALPHKPFLKFGQSSFCCLRLIQAQAWRDIKLKSQLEAQMEWIRFCKEIEVALGQMNLIQIGNKCPSRKTSR